MCVQSLDLEDSLEGVMATHSSILTWTIPWTEEPGRLQSIGSQRFKDSRFEPSVSCHISIICHELFPYSHYLGTFGVLLFILQVSG